MMHLVMKFQSSNEATNPGGSTVGVRAFESSLVLIIGVLVLGLIPGCGPP